MGVAVLGCINNYSCQQTFVKLVNNIIQSDTFYRSDEGKPWEMRETWRGSH